MPYIKQYNSGLPNYENDVENETKAERRYNPI